MQILYRKWDYGEYEESYIPNATIAFLSRNLSNTSKLRYLKLTHLNLYFIAQGY